MKKKLQYTKGPWKAIVRKDGSVYKEKGDYKAGSHTAYDIYDDPNRANFETDHRLEDSAPKLYYMVKQLRNVLAGLPTHDGEISPYVQMADALLAEIEGNE